MNRKPRLADNLPRWAKERRQPTRAELAEKHFADGGGVASTHSNGDSFAAEEVGATELVPLSPGSNILIRKPK